MTTTLKHELKADALLDQGIALLWSKGYNATSVNDIVKSAGIPKGSFYFYFDSKEDFAVQALEKYFNSQIPRAIKILQNPAVSAKQRVLDFYEYRVVTLKEELECTMGCMACNLANEMAEHNEAIRNVIASKGEFIKNQIANTIEEAQSDGDISTKIKARDLAEFIEDAGKGAMTTMKEMKSPYPINNLMNIIRSILIK
jgi:TetR/AcrR family transcriptional repressor of nem operon